MASPQINVIIEDLDRFTEKKMVGLALEVTANLREDTPRDTGWARSSWVPALGRPSEQIAQPSGRPTSADVALAKAESERGLIEINRYALEMGSIFVSNNTPYIVPLNEGHSKQAGAGFVQRCVERAVREGPL